jgi:hypothetical protein
MCLARKNLPLSTSPRLDKPYVALRVNEFLVLRSRETDAVITGRFQPGKNLNARPGETRSTESRREEIELQKRREPTLAPRPAPDLLRQSRLLEQPLIEPRH